MKHLVGLTLLLCAFFSQASFAYDRFEIQRILSNGHRPITYGDARYEIFSSLYNNSGEVCDVYSSHCIETRDVPSAKIMNVEHTWPQSKGATGDAKGDLHHLFPTDSNINSVRSSLPFCDVVEVKWQEEESKRGYNTYGEHCFEPPTKHKGNVARALFYFAIRYNYKIDKNQESFLRRWHEIDPVDQDEMDKNDEIQKIQNNRNFFIDHPEEVKGLSDF